MINIKERIYKLMENDEQDELIKDAIIKAMQNCV